MKTVGEMLRWRTQQTPDQVAIRHAGRAMTYRELDRRANMVANALLRSGLQPRQRVVVLDQGHDQFFEVVFGIAKAGGVFTPVNWRLAAPEIAYVINDAQAPFLFVGEVFAQTVDGIEGDLAAVRHIVRWGDALDAEWTGYDEFLAGAPDTDPRRDTPEADTAWQLYTSGTTGHPKGAEITHLNLSETASRGALGFGGIQTGDVGLVCMPLYHIGGSGWALCLALAGATMVVTREANPGEILELIPRYGINHAFMVPALMNFLLQPPRCRETDFGSLKTILYGAAPIPEELLKASIKTFGCRLIQAYGLTETTGAVVLLPAWDHTVGSPRLRACGLPIFGCEVRIVDEHGTLCGPHEVGEILIKGASVMKGYWNRPDDTAQAIRDGWFHSGDAGYLDADGYLYIHDRVKDMIVSGGENVYPAEVESVLFAHPGVADVAVVGVPDERWGETVKAVVVRAAGSTVTADELITHCQGKLAGYKRPRSVDFVETLPRNPTGKILKRELRAKYWEGRTRQVN
jgi:long-chain acyl-CoA synthetase